MAADRLQAARLAGQLRRSPELPLPFETDPTGFPMVWVEAIAAWMHWLPPPAAGSRRRTAPIEWSGRRRQAS
jgi:hypothetical protein